MEIIKVDVVDESIKADVSNTQVVNTGGGTNNYNKLSNLPKINGITLKDNLTTKQLGIIEDVETYIEEHKEELKGADGKDGVDGKDGYTPVKYVDYFTEEDKQEFLNEVEKEIEIPTKVSELENDKNYATTQEVADAISKINSFKKEIVSELPTTDIDENTIYLVLKVDGTGSDYYDEYLYINGKFELVGNTKIDLTDYMKNKGTAERPLYNNQELALLSDVPTKTSQLLNDSDFITSSALPKNLSDLNNDKEYQTKTDVETLIENAVGVALGGSY